MVETRLPDEILHEIEEDLRQDQDLWKHIHTDLHALGAPSARARPRTRWIVLGAVASVIALFAAFAVGWQTAPGTTEEVAVTRIVTVAPLPGIAEDKYEALAGLHGVPMVEGAVVERAVVERATPQPGIPEDKYEVLARLHGVPQPAAPGSEEFRRGGKGTA